MFEIWIQYECGWQLIGGCTEHTAKDIFDAMADFYAECVKVENVEVRGRGYRYSNRLRGAIPGSIVYSMRTVDGSKS